MDQIYIFPECLADPVVGDLLKFREENETLSYFTAFTRLMEFARKEALTPQTVREYGVRLLLDAPLSGIRFCDEELTPYLQNDVEAIYEFFFLYDWNSLCLERDVLPPPPGIGAGDRPVPEAYLRAMERFVAADSSGELLGLLIEFFRQYADRSEALYLAFRWRHGRIRGIAQPDLITFDQLGGLEYQKSMLLHNTEAFLSGMEANDILLVGGSGTGKSSCVKATLHHFRDRGLRLLELSKADIGALPDVMRALRGKKQRYIIFIDDLSFEGADSGYRALKVALEGQLEKRPDNIMIYATSNRRHLVRETWKERNTDDDIHENDTLHEKLSLSERFGIRLYFSSLTQPEYFAIVELLLQHNGIAFNEDIAKSAAAWASTNNGRSGRSAKQFVIQYLARGTDI